jgi:ABC-2 type transport system permease protein
MKLLRDTSIIYRRQMRFSLRMPMWLFFALIQPIMYLALFGPLLEQVTKTPGFPSTDSWRFFVPGLVVQLGIFGTLYVGFGLIEEIRFGVLDRMRVSPVSRTAILLGHVLRDATTLVVQTVILTLAAIPFGLSLTKEAAIGGLVFVVLLAVSFGSLSYGVAMVAKDEEPLIGLLNLVGPPLLLLSGILLPMSFGPDWLQWLAKVNPVSHVVDGLRDMFQGEWWSADIGWGLFAATLLALACVTFAVRTFQRENP